MHKMLYKKVCNRQISLLRYNIYVEVKTSGIGLNAIK